MLTRRPVSSACSSTAPRRVRIWQMPMRNKDPDAYFSITVGGDAPATVRFPRYGNYELLGVGGEDTILDADEQVQQP